VDVEKLGNAKIAATDRISKTAMISMSVIPYLPNITITPYLNL
jgi:hypothetical protein